MLSNFSFITEDLAGSALPGQWGDLAEDLSDARARGVTAVVTLTERPLPVESLQREGLAYLHLPIEDYTAPSLAQVREFVAFVEQERADDGVVLAHCRAGIGRTGTMLAAWLIHQGMTTAEAIREVRTKRRGSIETDAQEDLLAQWEAYLSRTRR